MPCGKEKVVHYTGGWTVGAAPQLIQRLKNGTWFGFAEVDIEIPEPLRPKFEEMCPFFYNKKVPVEAVPQQMLDYLKRTGRNRGDRKKLVGALSRRKAAGVRPSATLVCRSRGGDHGCLSNDRLYPRQGLRLVCGAGNRGSPYRRR